MALNPINKASIQEGKIWSWIEQCCRWGLSMFGKHSQGPFFFLIALLGAWKQCHLSVLCFHHCTLGGLKSALLPQCTKSAQSPFGRRTSSQNPFTVFNTQSVLKLLSNQRWSFSFQIVYKPQLGQNCTALEFVWVIYMWWYMWSWPKAIYSYYRMYIYIGIKRWFIGYVKTCHFQRKFSLNCQE